MTKSREPEWLLIEAVLAVQKMLIAEYGGATGVRDRRLLESALARPQNLFGYEDFKPPLARLAASYAFGLAKNHPFVDGNKRTALASCLAFLWLNDREVIANPKALTDLVLGVARGEAAKSDVAVFLKRYGQKVRR